MANNIRKIRKIRRISTEEIGRYIEKSNPRVYAIEKDDLFFTTKSSKVIKQKLAELFNCDPQYLDVEDFNNNLFKTNPKLFINQKNIDVDYNTNSNNILQVEDYEVIKYSNNLYKSDSSMLDYELQMTINRRIFQQIIGLAQNQNHSIEVIEISDSKMSPDIKYQDIAFVDTTDKKIEPDKKDMVFRIIGQNQDYYTARYVSRNLNGSINITCLKPDSGTGTETITQVEFDRIYEPSLIGTITSLWSSRKRKQWF